MSRAADDRTALDVLRILADLDDQLGPVEVAVVCCGVCGALRRRDEACPRCRADLLTAGRR